MKVYFYFLTLILATFSYSQDIESQIEQNYQKYRTLVDSQTDSALVYVLKAKDLNQKLNDTDWHARIHYGIGYCFYVQQKYLLALENFNQAVSFAKKSSNANMLSKSYNQIGLIYSLQNDFKKA